MQVDTYIYQEGEWNRAFEERPESSDVLILIFSSLEKEEVQREVAKISAHFPRAILFGASTSGEIFKDEVYDDTIIVSVVQFEHTRLKNHTCRPIVGKRSYQDGVEIAQSLYGEDLKGIFLLSDGIHTNGTKLTEGIASVVASDVTVSGGLAGDKDRFEKTWIVSGGEILEGYVCAIGFYGEHIRFRTASQAGWDRLGLTRTVTRSRENVVYEFDGKPALEIYKRYLGEKAKELPGSALLFPLELQNEYGSEESVVRTILAIDEKENSMTFAGDIPQGAKVTFMKANFNRLVDGAEKAAELLDLSDYDGEAMLCIAISCVGRKLVLKSRIYEEVEVIGEVLPDQTHIIGFYSYGEISPSHGGCCNLHNQTMTLTALWEESDA